jgi:hypothetical protein
MSKYPHSRKCHRDCYRNIAISLIDPTREVLSVIAWFREPSRPSLSFCRQMDYFRVSRDPKEENTSLTYLFETYCLFPVIAVPLR